MKKLILTALLLIFSFCVFSQNEISHLHKKTKPISIYKIAKKSNIVKIKVSKKDKLQPKSEFFIKAVYGTTRKRIRIA